MFVAHIRKVNYNDAVRWAEVKERVPIGSRPINPLNAELNPICHLMALLGAHHIFHVSKIRVKYQRSYL
jgi:hypothetical protein